MSDNNKKISSNRKILYYAGMGLTIIGFILFISVFFSVFTGLGFGSFDRYFGLFNNAFIGMILMIAGSVLMNIGRRGLAGSGVILDPEKAREDLKPHTKAMGGMLNDALEEVDAIKPKTTEVIKIRCPKCHSLNDESAKFCAECGEKL